MNRRPPPPPPPYPPPPPPPPKRQKKDSDGFDNESQSNNGQQLSNTVVHRPIPRYPALNHVPQAISYPSGIPFHNVNIMNVFNTGHISQLLHSYGVNPIPHMNSLIPYNSLVAGHHQTTINAHALVVPYHLSLTNTNLPSSSQPLLFPNGHQTNSINNWNSQQLVAQLHAQLSAIANSRESTIITNRVARDYTLLLPDELIAKIFDSFGCDDRENYKILVNLFYVNMRWRGIITEPKNYRLMKSLRIGVTEIIFAQTGADYIFKVVEYEYKELMHIWSNEKDWITENVNGRWSELMKERPVKNAPLPPGLDSDLSLKFSRFKPVRISFENIIIGKPLLRLLSQILSKYERHDDICFAKFDNDDGIADVTFEDNVVPDDLFELFPHFLYIRGVPPRYWSQQAFDKWVLAEKRSDFHYEEDDRKEEGFDIRNGEIKNYPISLKNFSRVHIFTSNFAETSINEIFEAAKARMINEAPMRMMDNQEVVFREEEDIRWHMAMADIHVDDVGELMEEAAERHNIKMNKPHIFDRPNGHGTVWATLRINGEKAIARYYNYANQPSFVEVVTANDEDNCTTDSDSDSDSDSESNSDN